MDQSIRERERLMLHKEESADLKFYISMNINFEEKKEKLKKRRSNDIPKDNKIINKNVFAMDDLQ